MKATLYEALAVSPDASDEEVRAALRRQIRKYYARTRDGHGNVEEALRFINHASCILSNPDRRAVYDHELAISGASLEQRIAHVVGDAVGRKAQANATTELSDDPPERRSLAAGSSLHPGLTERVTSLRRPTGFTVALYAVFGAAIAVAIALITPTDSLVVAKQVLVALTVGLVLLTLIYGTVHGIAWARRGHDGNAALFQHDFAIVNWRREKSVFLGANQPQEDASWVFQLRMAELERAKVQRTSLPHPWNRLGARLFDYALWGLILALLVAHFASFELVPDTLAFWLMHPLVAPIVISATWMPLEALLTGSARTTPGKWLFGVHLQFSISNAYAVRDNRSQLPRAFRRAFRVWWQGAACGFPLLAPFLASIAYEKVVRDQETGWDFAEDCLVTYTPPGGLNTATGIVGLVAMLWLYGIAWQPMLEQSVAQARTYILAMLPSPGALWSSSFGGGDAATTGGGAVTSVPHTIAPGSRTEPDRQSTATSARASSTGSIDPDLERLFAERHARIKALRSEGLRMLEVHNWRRAKDLCRAWTDLELGSSEAWRCLGEALQAQGQHRDAINAFRKAKQFDPDDRSLDAAIARSQRGIVNDFLQRQGR